MRYVCNGCDIHASHFLLTLSLLVNSTLDKHTPFRQETTRVDPVEYYGCVGVLIPSLRIIDSRTQDLVARPCLVLSFFQVYFERFLSLLWDK